MHKSQLFLIYLLIFIFGVFVANTLYTALGGFFNDYYIFLIVLFLAILPIMTWGYKKFTLSLLALAVMSLGIWRFAVSLPQIDKKHIASHDHQLIKFIGQVIKEPDIRQTHRKVALSNIVMLDKKMQSSRRGRVLVNVPNYPEIKYGDWLKISCQLKQPGKIDDFDYAKYLSVKGIYSVCYKPETVNLINGPTSKGQKIMGYIYQLKYQVKQVVDETISYPQSEIMSAMVLGLRKNIPENILQNFRQSGLSHIIAISGLHISIITFLFFNLLIAIGFNRKYAFPLSIVALILFLIMIGFRSSSIRAGIMGISALWALQVGRLKNSINALVFAAAVLLLINPKLLLNEIGFQLSFLAVLGIIYFGERISQWLAKIKVPQFFEIRSTLMMTLSAQLMVLPLIVYYFGNLSVISPLSNILVLPAMPFIMIVGFLTGLIGIVWLPLAKLIGLLTEVLIGWIMTVAKWSSNFPYGNFNLKIDWIIVFVIYLLLAWLIWYMRNYSLAKKLVQDKIKDS